MTTCLGAFVLSTYAELKAPQKEPGCAQSVSAIHPDSFNPTAW